MCMYVSARMFRVPVCACVEGITEQPSASRSLGGDGVPHLPTGRLLGLHYGQGRAGAAQTLA